MKVKNTDEMDLIKITYCLQKVNKKIHQRLEENINKTYIQTI